EAVPCFEHMLNSLSFDQCAGKHSAKFLRARAWLEALHIYSARQIKQLFLRKPTDAKCLCGLVGQDQERINERVFSHKPLRLEQQPIFPPLNSRKIACRCWLVRLVDFLLAAVAMPGRDFYDGGDAALFRHLQRAQAIARPAVKKIITPRREMPRSDPVEIFLLRPVIVRTIKKRNQAHRMPAQRVNE